ncbi:MAG: citrate/2-methylcitrate synthase, partial [Desulfomonilia bacterium]|nr:citrate/2-methylcitrate synthase [Desulfomonilia bacterium]
MRAKTLSEFLKEGDRVAVSNITGREASRVSEQSQKYCGNIVGGWALGKSGSTIETPRGSIPVYATFEELMKQTPPESRPNKIIIYSPPQAVYGEIKEVVDHGREHIETIFVITEHVSVEVTSKLHAICSEAGIDVVGCNTLGMINVHDRVRVGAVGGDSPQETFIPGSVTILSNSGNMVNTIASYLLASGMGISYGISTGKDILILTPLKDLIFLAETDPRTKVIVLYIEPGGLYEHEAIEAIKTRGLSKPVVVYVAGKIAETYNVSLGHAGAVVEGNVTSASAKMRAFDAYFGIEAFSPDRRYKKTEQLLDVLNRGIRVTTLHHIPKAMRLICDTLGIDRDISSAKPLKLNPWFVNLGDVAKHIPHELDLARGTIPDPYAQQVKEQEQARLGISMARQSMRNASHASSNDGVTPRIHGYSLMDVMAKKSFVASLVLSLTGELPRDEFEENLAQMTFIASLTNGPGTISAQGAKLSCSAGNSPNTAIIATLAAMGSVHGGNGSQAVRFLLDVFAETGIEDPYDSSVDVKDLAQKAAEEFKRKKLAAKEASLDYARIPCLGHPIFKKDPVNHDPREQVIHAFITSQGRCNIFLEFYHALVEALKENGTTNTVMAVNVDAALACVWLGICWRHLREKRMTIQRAMDIPFIVFALGRAAGGAA